MQDNILNNTLEKCLSLNNATVMAVRKEPLLDTDTTLAIIYIVIMGIALLVGTCGNALILLVSAIMRGINKSGKEFILNLAIADLCVTAIADPLCIVGVYTAFHRYVSICILYVKKKTKNNLSVTNTFIKLYQSSYMRQNYSKVISKYSTMLPF